MIKLNKNSYLIQQSTINFCEIEVLGLEELYPLGIIKGRKEEVKRMSNSPIINLYDRGIYDLDRKFRKKIGTINSMTFDLIMPIVQIKNFREKINFFDKNNKIDLYLNANDVEKLQALIKEKQ